MEAEGFSTRDQFWAAVATSLPQPIGAVAAYLVVEAAEPLLPVSFGFAAGAMLAIHRRHGRCGGDARPGRRTSRLARLCSLALGGAAVANRR